MTIIDALRLLYRFWFTIVACTLIGIALAGAYAFTQPKIYAAGATAFVAAGSNRDSTDAAIGSTVAAGKAQAYIEIMSSEQVARAVIEDLKLTDMSVQAVSGSISATASAGSPTIKVIVTSTSPRLAKDIANSVVRNAAKEASLIESDGSSQSSVRMVAISNAVLPSRPASPDVRRLLILGAGAGLAGGLLLSLLRRQLDRRIRSPEDVGEVTTLGIIGAIPKQRGLRTKVRSGAVMSSIVGEALRHVRTNVVYADPDSPPRVLLVTSPQAGEGKSTTAVLLARALADGDQKVVLIDADLRRPTVAHSFEIEQAVGLTQVLGGAVPLADALVETAVDGLRVLPAGRVPFNPAELVGSARFEHLIKELSDEHYVVIDAPPVLPVADAVIMSTRVDAVILVALNGVGTKDHLARALGLLGQVHARVLGVVLNGVPQGRSAGIYGYSSYGYGDYKQEARRGEHKRSERKRARRVERSKD